VGLVATKTTGP